MVHVRDKAWHAAADGSGVVVRVRLSPKSAADAIDQLQSTAEGVALKARVRAVPADGKANHALEKLLAEWLDLGARSVRVSAGHKSRIKSVALTGQPEILIARLEARCDCHTGKKGS